jgi:hypothetical protein
MKLRRDMTSLEVENKSHTAGMLHGHAKVDSHASSDLPLGQFLARLHLVVEDKHRTSERLKMIQIWSDFRPCKQLKGRLVILSSTCWCRVVNFIGHSESIRPEMSINSLWPSVLSMNQHGPCLVLQSPDPSFCHSILKMSIDPTESYCLTCFLDRCHELVLCKPAIVRLITLDLDLELGSIPLKGQLCFKSFICIG